MTSHEARRGWLERWKALEQQGQDAKDSPGVLLMLSDYYRSLDAGSKAEISELLIEWLEAPDEARRFDAIALVSEFSIVSALPTLRRLANRLETATDPSAPYEWAKVNRVIGRLSEAAG